MDDRLNGEALRLHMEHCDGCDECRRELTPTEARELQDAIRADGHGEAHL